jgi:hypothetical protein
MNGQRYERSRAVKILGVDRFLNRSGGASGLSQAADVNVTAAFEKPEVHLPFPPCLGERAALTSAQAIGCHRNFGSHEIGYSL